MEQNAALASQALAFRVDPCRMAKHMSAFFGLPSNPITDEGVTYDGDENGTVHFRLYYPNASTVSIVFFEQTVSLTKGDDGVWTGTGHFSSGFKDAFILVDNQEVLCSYLPLSYTSCRPSNYIEVPPADVKSCFYAMRPGVECGSVVADLFMSTENTAERLLIYLPPSYRKEANATRRYPVLYLLHGLSGNEIGWVHQGRINFIADNLIADGKMTDMIIVMGNGMMYKEDDSVDTFKYVDRLVKDVIPYVDANYRTLADRDHRAVAGLSMGSMQATYASMEHPDLFSAVGIFSGFMRTVWSDPCRTDDAHFTKFQANPQAYRDAMKLVYRAMGDVDPFRSVFEEDSELLDKLAFKDDVRKIMKGAHTWQVWRMCAADFLPLLFKK